MQSTALLALAWPGAVVADSLRAPPANALILFGAHWCAPCTAELQDLGAIINRLAMVAADDPRRSPPQLALAWIDRPVASGTVNRALDTVHSERQPPRVIIPPPAAAAAWADAQMTRAHGLPFAVVTDPDGAICALRAGALQPEAIADLWAACHHP